MPALFAYLFSLLVFIGSGYAGLVWLTEPAAKTGNPPMAMAENTAGTLPHKGRSKAQRTVASDVGTANLGAPSTPEAPSTPDTETAPAKAKVADNSDDVASGTTAERSAPAANVSSAASRGSEQDKNDLPTKDAQKPDKTDSANRGSAPSAVLATSGGVSAQESQPPSETTATGNVRSANPQDKPVAPLAATHNADTNGDMASRDEASRGEVLTRPAHHAQKEAKRDTKPRDRYDGNRKTLQQASRSKLVMMTLQTIEFPDGHREERLVPLRHSWTEDE